jgi:hypothetical protein
MHIIGSQHFVWRRKYLTEVPQCSERCDNETLEECTKARRLRCRSMALRYDGHYDAAIADINTALKCMDSRGSNNQWKFRLLDRKGRTHFLQAEDKIVQSARRGMDGDASELLRLSIEAFEGALECLREDNVEEIRHINQLKAKAEARCGRIEDCLESVKRATEGEPRKVLALFDDIVSVLIHRDQKDAITRLLQRVPETQLAYGYLPHTYEALHMAVSTNRTQRNMQVLDKMYESSIQALEMSSMLLPANSLRLWQGIFQRCVAEEPDRAKSLLQEVFEFGGSAIDVQLVIPASWQLAETLLEEFYEIEADLSANLILTRRHEICDRMQRLIHGFAFRIPQCQQELSPLSIVLHLMQKRLGSFSIMKRQADDIFAACHQALQDERSDNDPPSFQMLSKILALVPGLEKQASAAAAYQFYVINVDTYAWNKPFPTHGEVATPFVEKARWDGYLEETLASRKLPDKTKVRQVEYKDYWQIKCGGSCGRTIDPSGTFDKAYLCYYCTDTTLCPDCYVQLTQKQRLDGWRARCRYYHQLIEFALRPPHGGKTTSTSSAVLDADSVKEFKAWHKMLEKQWDEAWVKNLSLETQ